MFTTRTGRRMTATGTTPAWIRALALAAGLLAGHAAAAPAHLQASMLIRGTISVTPQGAVKGYTLQHADELPEPVVQLIARNAPHWRFRPVLRHGHPVGAKASMNIRIDAKPLPGKRIALSIGNTLFGNGLPDASIQFDHRDVFLRHIPRDLLSHQVAGMVYLVLRVDAHGHVRRAAAEQVNLYVTGPAPAMRQWREELAQAFTKLALTWTFKVPAASGRDHWTVRTPIGLWTGNREVPGFNAWQSFVPGPRKVVPWLAPGERIDGGVDGLPSGGLYLASSALQRIRASTPSNHREPAQEH